MHRCLDVRRFAVALATAVATLVVPAIADRAAATPAVTMDVATGEVLYAQDATQPWFPASTTKLMTVYVALNAVREHQIALNTPLVVSARAHKMPPSKMGFPIGTQVTLDNALKMLMVRSANDIAITIAEGVSGSVEGFADDMNRQAALLGLHESHFVNPNGLPDAEHVSSARDMAIIARALYAQFPEQSQLFNLGALSMGREIIANHNNLLGRYPGVDGMKTGFTCAAGFNIVASAFRDGRRLVVVVFGAPSVAVRSGKVAALLDRGFAGIDRPSGSILTLASAASTVAPDMRDHVCRKGRVALIAQFDQEIASLDAPLEAPPTPVGGTIGLPALNPERAFLSVQPAPAPAAAGPGPMALRINTIPQPIFDPVPVHIGADVGYSGVVAQARVAHTPVGSEPQPVTAAAYAETPPGLPQRIGGTPLEVDTGALPMKGRKARQARRTRTPAMRAAATGPSTKVIAGAQPAPAKGKGKKVVAKPAAKQPTAKKVAAKPAPKPAPKAAAKATKKPKAVANKS